LIDDSGHVTWIHSVEQERRLKETVARAMARATAAQRAVESAEFKQRLADIGARQKEIAAADAAKIQREVDAAFNDARVQAALARAQEKIASAAMREGRRQAEEARREVERSMRELAPLERAPATP